MAEGPGKYDDLCTEVRKKAGAVGAMLMIFEGSEGSGFSVQIPGVLLPMVAEFLRDTADQIEADLVQIQKG